MNNGERTPTPDTKSEVGSRKYIERGEAEAEQGDSLPSYLP